MSAGSGLRGSPLVQLAARARRPSRWWLAWLVALLIIHFITPLGTFIGRIVVGDPAATDAWYPYVDAFTALAVLLALFVWVRFKEGRPLSTVGFRPRWDWARPLLGLVVGAGLAGAVVVLGLIIGVYQGGQSTHPLNGVGLPALLPLILLQLLCASGDQAITSGYMLQMGARQLPVWIAILGTSIIFAMQQTLNLLALLNLVLFGTFAGLVALRQGSLWLVIGIQAGWNYCQDNIFGLPRAGIADPVALLSIGATPGTSTTLSGGQFGLATGLLATFVLGAAIAGALFGLRRTKPTAPQDSPLEPAAVAGTPHTPLDVPTSR